MWRYLKKKGEKQRLFSFYDLSGHKNPTAAY